MPRNPLLSNRSALRRHHRQWLRRQQNTCPLFLCDIGDPPGPVKYHKYNFHHTHRYDCRALPGWNYIAMSPAAHAFMHLLGGVWPWEMKLGAVELQNKRARGLPISWLWRFPNPAQRLLNAWLRLQVLTRCCAAWVVAFGVGVMVLRIFVI